SDVTAPVSPSRVARSRPPAKSNTVTAPLFWPTASAVPSGEYRTTATGPACFQLFCSISDGTCQNRTSWPQPTASVRPPGANVTPRAPPLTGGNEATSWPVCASQSFTSPPVPLSAPALVATSLPSGEKDKLEISSVWPARTDLPVRPESVAAFSPRHAAARVLPSGDSCTQCSGLANPFSVARSAPVAVSQRRTGLSSPPGARA